jgi:hypothetical protein
MVTLEGRKVCYRPVPVTGLRSGDYEALIEHSSNTYPYGLVNMASEYTARIPHLFVDPAERDHVSDLYLIDLPEPDHPVPTVNVVEIRQIMEDSLSTISKESTGSTESHETNYTRTLIDPYGQEFLAFPPSFGGTVFAVSNDEPPRDGETDQERVAREERNADSRAWRVDLENTEENATNAGAGGLRNICHDLADAFDMCDNQQVFKTPSANITITMNELNKFPKSSALNAIKSYLKATTVQVNERCTPAPSVSTTRSHRQRGSWQQGGPYLYQGHNMNYEAHHP